MCLFFYDIRIKRKGEKILCIFFHSFNNSLLHALLFSSGCFFAASAYENRLALFSTSISAGSDIVDKVETLFGLRITFPPMYTDFNILKIVISRRMFC